VTASGERPRLQAVGEWPQPQVASGRAPSLDWRGVPAPSGQLLSPVQVPSFGSDRVPHALQIDRGKTIADEDEINLPWFLTASHGRGRSHSPQQRGGGRGYIFPTRRPQIRPSMASCGSQTCPTPASTLSSVAATTSPTAPSSSVVATTTPTAPSSSVPRTATATPSSSAEAQHTPTQVAQIEGTDYVLIDDDVPVGGKRKLKSDV
jgi:hypothetical protein